VLLALADQVPVDPVRGCPGPHGRPAPSRRARCRSIRGGGSPRARRS